MISSLRCRQASRRPERESGALLGRPRRRVSGRARVDGRLCALRELDNDSGFLRPFGVNLRGGQRLKVGTGSRLFDLGCGSQSRPYDCSLWIISGGGLTGLFELDRHEVAPKLLDGLVAR